MLAGVAVLAAGFLAQLLVYGHGGRTSLSDLPHVFLSRGVGPSRLPYIDRVVEYPVGGGMLLWVATLVRNSPLGVLTVTGTAAAGLALFVGVTLRRHFGPRAWRWMVGPPIALFAFQNWDVFAIAAMVGGLIAYRRSRPALSGFLLGLGAVIKLFPAVLIPVLVADRIRAGDRRGAVLVGGTGVATVLVGNAPFALANPSGWWWTMQFQGRRRATWGSLWPYLHRWIGLPVASASAANVASMVVLVGGLATVVLLTARGRLDWLGASAAAMVLFVLANKVYSPTYDLWLVAFFVMVPVSRRVWTAFWLVDLMVFATVYGYFHGQVGRAVVVAALPVLVLVRAAVLLRLVAVAARGRRVTGVDIDVVGMPSTSTGPDAAPTRRAPVASVSVL